MIYSLKKVSKLYDKYKALNEVDLDIEESSIVVILGPSGSGKSTLLNILGGIDSPTSGKITFDKKDVSKLSEEELTTFRKEHIGFIFQSYNLIANLSIKENVELGEELSTNPIDKDKIMTLLDVKRHEDKFPYQLSGGEQQRVSIARSIVKNPKILMCDEPTGALDEEKGKNVLEALIDINKEYKTTIIIVTHNPSIADLADKVIKLNSGKISELIINEKRKEVKEINWA